MADLEPTGPGWDYPAGLDDYCTFCESDECECDEPDYEQIAADRAEARADRGIGRLMANDQW